MGYKVYYLSDPRIGKPRYYGVTKSTLEKRLYNHYSKYYRTSPKDDWLDNMKLDNVRADITLIIEYEDKKQALSLESSLIINGNDLFNLIANNGYKNAEYKDRFETNSILSKERHKLRNITYPKKQKEPKPKNIKTKRVLKLTTEEKERRLAILRPYWFKKKN